MSGPLILECLKEIKVKNCEGYDCIPQRTVDGAEVLIAPLSNLFEKIYTQKAIPPQWSVAKIIPIHKKAPKTTLKIIDQ